MLIKKIKTETDSKVNQLEIEAKIKKKVATQLEQDAKMLNQNEQLMKKKIEDEIYSDEKKEMKILRMEFYYLI